MAAFKGVRRMTRRSVEAILRGAVGLAAGGIFSCSALAQTQSLTFAATYSVSAKGVEAGEFALNVKLADGRYEANATRRATGLIRSLVGASQDYVYSARGAVTARGVQPIAYEHSGGKRGRIVRVRFGMDDVVTTATPAMGMGNPPATKAQRLGSMDQVSALVAMMLDAQAPCDGTKRVFMDGRARFDFVMSPAGEETVRTRAYKGQAYRCTVRFAPIAGFPDPQEPATMRFLFARTDKGVLAPLRIEMPTDDAGLAVLEAKKFSFGG